MKIAREILIFNIWILTVSCYKVAYVKRLYADLFLNYDKRVLPASDVSKPIDISVSFSLLDIYGIDMRTQFFSKYVSLKLSWKDYFLQWNASNYGDLKQITSSFADVWKPDIIVLNSASTRKSFANTDDDNYNVILRNNGIVDWRVYTNLNTRCLLDTTRYPFDNQTCEINISKLSLNDGYETIHNNNNETNYLDNFVPNGEWEVQRITSSIKVHIRDGHMMSTLVYRIQMERLRTFYTWNFLMPVGSLALAGLFTFYLPAKSQEKIALSLFVFLSIGVLTRLFNESIPSTSNNISVFGRLLWINLLISGLIIIVNIVSMALYHCKSPKSISKCCPDITDSFKCKCFKCWKYCMVDKPRGARQMYNMDMSNSSYERTAQTGQTVIKHKDIEINIDDRMDETVINHRGMNIKLGVLKNIPSYQAEWSDVSRNVDVIAFWLFLAAYIVVYVTQILYIIY
jgi:hypothetical protein